MLFLHCVVHGSPRPRILWKMPSGQVLNRPQIRGRIMLQENGTLSVRSVQIQDRGRYICQAENAAGKARISISVVVVAYPPKITATPPPSILARAGTRLQLNCIAVGIPKPEITWELPGGFHIGTSGTDRVNSNLYLHPTGTLYIRKASHGDTGFYRCVARNQLGIDRATTYVYFR